MSTRVVERVDDWVDRPFTGGYRELQDLADQHFSGVVRAGGAELFMTKGTVVGILRGDIEDFEDVEGTRYEAPTPALPLLAIMQERTDEVRAKYYTEETAISEVDRTLSDGGFTGFIELSENVLSGDYYLVYHQGHSMSVAFVGTTEQLLEDEEAFERADDEVGIYEVRPVDVDPIEIPEPPEPEPDTETEPDSETGTTPPEGVEQTTATETRKSDSTGGVPAEPGESTDTESQETEDKARRETQESSDGSGGTEAATAGQSAAADRQRGVDDADEPAETDGTVTTREAETSEPASSGHERPEETSKAEGRADRNAKSSATEGQSADEISEERPVADRTSPPEPTDSTTAETTTRTGNGTPETAREPTPETEPTRSETTRTTSAEPERRSATQRRETDPGVEKRAARPPRADSEGGRHLETRAIPSLDPERTETVERADESSSARADAPRREPTGRAHDHEEQQPRRGQEPDTDRDATQAGTETRSEPATEPEPTETEPTAETPDMDTGGGSGAVDSDQVEELEAELDEKETEIERLETELEAASEETERLEDELASVREERDELAAEVDRLEGELEQLESEFGVASDAERRITPQEALEGTDIFVRYHSKGDATLEKAHGSGTRRTDVDDNLRLEKHTQFDAATVAVGGQTYAEFIEDRLEYQFVTWAITELMFEIRDTGHENSLRNLYDALPKVDRAELNGAVDVTYTEDGQETRSTESFDVVLRDRMGDPLLVANLNDSREAATEAMMEGLITSAERVGQTSDDFAAAFLVTRSFFEPGALETASEATRGGLLSRDKRKSFVNLSRKRGYHLCLVEARNQNFHLAVPEL